MYSMGISGSENGGTVLYFIKPYFGGISPYIGLIQALYMVGTSDLGS